MDAPLTVALARLGEAMRMHLHRLRARGRTSAADRLGGLVIEGGEPEALLDEISTASDHRAGPARTTLAAAVPEFQHAQRVFELTDLERDALLVAVAPEVDSRFARLFGFLNDSVVALRPTVGLITTLLAPSHAPAAVPTSFLADAPLRRLALVSLSGGSTPLAGQTVTLAPTWWPRLVGATPAAAISPAVDLDTLVLSPAIYAEACAIAAWWRQRRDGVVIIEGVAGSGRDALARAIAARAGYAAVAIRPTDAGWPDPGELARDARWGDGAALLSDPPDEVAHASLTAAAPLALVTNQVSGLSLAGLTRPVRVLRVPAFDALQRAALWLRAAPDAPPPAHTALAARFQLGPARIAEVVQRERDGATHAQHLGSLVAAARKASAMRFDGLAAYVEPGRDTLIVPVATQRELATAHAWARQRRQVFGRDAVGGHLQLAPGLVCLFWGPPGTGKTLAARQIAHAAEVDLYRVDLAQVVSKYIGETEKRLAALLDECERGDVAILFDEADALFGKRTAVKDAHDRYANIETGFLLQRLEATTALVILTSNLRDNLDAAFARRLHIVAEFPAPGPAERAALWRMLLPPAVAADDRVDIEFLARFDLRGGDIRNAVAAALVTTDAPDPERLMHFLVWAVWRELRKAGRLVAANDFGRWEALALHLGRGGRPDA